MARLVKSLSVVLIAAMLTAMVAPPCEALIECKSIEPYLLPCLPIVMDETPYPDIKNKTPLATCCRGIRGVFASGTTRENRRNICDCWKSRSRSFYAISHFKFLKLPYVCGIKMPYVMDATTDCTKVK